MDYQDAKIEHLSELRLARKYDQLDDPALFFELVGGMTTRVVRTAVAARMSSVSSSRLTSTWVTREEQGM